MIIFRSIKGIQRKQQQFGKQIILFSTMDLSLISHKKYYMYDANQSAYVVQTEQGDLVIEVGI